MGNLSCKKKNYSIKKTAEPKITMNDYFRMISNKNIGNIELCCYTELVLRCYNHHALQGNSWFVNPEYAQNVLDILKN